MTDNRAYLDYNASAPLRPASREAMSAAMEVCGNASSVHFEGRTVKAIVERARRQVAALVNANPEGVIFTSGATEAANLGLAPQISSGGVHRDASKLYVLETEHPCVLAGGRFKPDDIVPVPVLSNGLVDTEAFDGLLEAHDEEAGAPFLACQLANSETGIIQPVAELAQKVRFKGGYVLCDAVQAVGRIPVDAKALNVDFLILSAHKIGGPSGVGALIKVHDVLDITPAIAGGGQEKNRRAGTENVVGIVGFGAAAEEALSEAGNIDRIVALRDSLSDRLAPICAANGLSADRLIVFGQDVSRIGNTIMFAVDGLKAETALIAFDLDGVSVSSGSACSSGKVGKSHVLEAMNVQAGHTRGAIRVSLGWNSTEADIEKFCHAFDRITKRLADMLKEEMSGAA